LSKSIQTVGLKLTHPDTSYKCCKFHKYRAKDTPLRSVFIPKFSNIWAKFSALGVTYPYPCTGRCGWNLAGRSSVPNITSIGARCRPCGAKTSKSLSE